MMQMSAEGRAKLTEPWEECVLYVYDDKQPKRRVNGILEYPEWNGGPVHGTLTVCWGHTDAAGAPKITQGMRFTQEQADQILTNDLEAPMAAVNRALKVEVTQHQFDALVDLTFNCPSALPHVAALVNAGKWDGAEKLMLQYIYSKGERMDGLVHRRTAEIAFANTPDDPEVAASTVISPKAEREPAPNSIATSATGSAAVATAGGGGAIFVSALSTLDQVNTAAGTIEGTGDHIHHLFDLLHHPVVVLCLGAIIVILSGYIWFSRRQKLITFHV